MHICNISGRITHHKVSAKRIIDLRETYVNLRDIVTSQIRTLVFKHYSFSSLSEACIPAFFQFLCVFSVGSGYVPGFQHHNERVIRSGAAVE